MTKSTTLESLGFSPFDAADHLRTPREVLEFLQDALVDEETNGAYFAHALGIVARALEKMGFVASSTGLSRESLYKALSGNRDPTFSTILKVTNALGYEFLLSPTKERTRPASRPLMRTNTTVPGASSMFFGNAPPSLKGATSANTAATSHVFFENVLQSLAFSGTLHTAAAHVSVDVATVSHALEGVRPTAASSNPRMMTLLVSGEGSAEWSRAWSSVGEKRTSDFVNVLPGAPRKSSRSHERSERRAG